MERGAQHVERGQDQFRGSGLSPLRLLCVFFQELLCTRGRQKNGAFTGAQKSDSPATNHPTKRLTLMKSLTRPTPHEKIK
jgi:hypothetical protein